MTTSQTSPEFYLEMNQRIDQLLENWYNELNNNVKTILK